MFFNRFHNLILIKFIFIRGERKRNRSKVLEINHFLDIQKEEFQELQDEPAGKFVSDLDIMEDID